MDSKKLSQVIDPWLKKATLSASDEESELSPSELIDLAAQVKAAGILQKQDLQNRAVLDSVIGQAVHQLTRNSPSLKALENNYIFRISQLFQYSLKNYSGNPLENLGKFTFPVTSDQAEEIARQYRLKIAFVTNELEKALQPSSPKEALYLLRALELSLTLSDGYGYMQTLSERLPYLEKSFEPSYNPLPFNREYAILKSCLAFLDSPDIPTAVKSAVTDRISILETRYGSHLPLSKQEDFYRLDRQLRKEKVAATPYPTLDFQIRELAGIPPHLLAKMRDNDQLHDPESTRIRIPLTRSFIYDILDNCENETSRRRAWYAMRGMDSTQEETSKANLTKLNRIRSVQSQITQLLDLNLKSTSDRFLRGGIIPDAESAELAFTEVEKMLHSSPLLTELKDLKRNLTGDSKAEFMPWDLWYLPNKLKAAKGSETFDQKFSGLSPEKVRDGIFQWASDREEGYNLEFKTLETITPFLTKYEVYDRDEEPPKILGILIVDTGVGYERGGYVKPIQQTYLLSETQSALYVNLGLGGAISRDKVRTAFHETGHAIRKLLGGDTTQDIWCDGDELFTSAFERASLDAKVLQKYLGITLTKSESTQLESAKNLEVKLNLLNYFVKARNTFDLYHTSLSPEEIEKKNYSIFFPAFMQQNGQDLKGYGISNEDKFYLTNHRQRMEHRYFLSMLAGIVMNQELFKSGMTGGYRRLKATFNLARKGIPPVRQLAAVLKYPDGLSNKEILSRILKRSREVMGAK